MPFKPGVSGNPAGRPRRPRAGQDALRRDLLRQAPEILAALVEAAKSGDPQAARLILDRCLPPLRPVDRASPIALGDSLTQASAAILAGLAAGTLTIDQGSRLAGIISSLARTQELTETERRLAFVENLLSERQNASKN
jgi:hypothetical protein